MHNITTEKLNLTNKQLLGLFMCAQLFHLPDFKRLKYSVPPIMLQLLYKTFQLEHVCTAVQSLTVKKEPMNLAICTFP